jgi:hypothetical protein
MTCLEDTYHFLEPKIYTGEVNDFTIIHAIVQRPTDNLRHPHAVVYNRKTGNIHEVSNDFKNKNVIMPFMLWIKLGKVSNVHQYTFWEYNAKLLETETWEFWDLAKKGIICPLDEWRKKKSMEK